ncbi:MAG: hypothetical protein ACI8W8_001572 [Rhodothermales bacterium]|jgi:hypothetical protein
MHSFISRCLIVVGLSFSVAANSITGFRTLKVTGQCLVKTAGEEDYVDAQNQTVYAFGTTLKTGRNSNMLLEFSQGNTFQLLPRTTLVLNQDTRNPKLKILRLQSGSISLQLDDFPKGHKLEVETPSAICGAVGTRFVVSFDEVETTPGETQPGRNSFSCSDGIVNVASRFKVGEEQVTGKSFSVPQVEAGTAIVAFIHEGLENTYTDVTVNRGALSFQYGDSKNNSFKVQATDGAPTRFICALEKSDKAVDMVALDVRRGKVDRETSRFFVGKKTESVTPQNGAVLVAGKELLETSKDAQEDAVGDYLAKAKVEGELHSKLVKLEVDGSNPVAIQDTRLALQTAATAATTARNLLKSKRIRSVMQGVRRASSRMNRRVPRR